MAGCDTGVLSGRRAHELSREQPSRHSTKSDWQCRAFFDPGLRASARNVLEEGDVMRSAELFATGIVLVVQTGDDDQGDEDKENREHGVSVGGSGWRPADWRVRGE